MGELSFRSLGGGDSYPKNQLGVHPQSYNANNPDYYGIGNNWTQVVSIYSYGKKHILVCVAGYDYEAPEKSGYALLTKLDEEILACRYDDGIQIFVKLCKSGNYYTVYAKSVSSSGGVIRYQPNYYSIEFN